MGMLRRLLLFLCLWAPLLVWLAPAWATPTPGPESPDSPGVSTAKPTVAELQSFAEKLRLRFAAGDQRGLLEQARSAPELSWIVLDDWLAHEPQPTLFTLVARGMQLAGDERGCERLRQRQLLEAELLSLRPEEAPSKDLERQLEGVDWKYWGQPLEVRLLDLGNYRQLLRLSAAFQAYAREAHLTTAPADLYAAESALLSGQFQLAVTRREQMNQWAHALPDPRNFAFLQALLLQAAQRGSQLSLAHELEGTLENSMEALPPEQRGLYTFLLETQRARRQLRATPDPQWPEMAGHHQKAMAALRQFHPGPSGNRLWMDGLGFWMNFLSWAQYQDLSADQAAEWQKQDSAEILRLAQEGISQNSYAAHLGSISLRLDQVLYQLKAEGESPAARPMLEVCEASQQQNRLWLEEDQALQQRTMPPALRARLGDDFQVQLLSGEWSQVQSRLGLVHLFLLEEGQDPTRWVVAVEKGAVDASTSMGYQGLQDPRWTCLDWLLLRRPSGWREHADRLIHTLLESGRRGNHLPTMISAWSYRGRLDQSVEALQTSAALLEEYLNESGGAAGLRLAWGEIYENLAELLLKQGRNQEALEVLARKSNVQSVELGSQALSEAAGLGQLAQQGQAIEQELAVETSLGQSTDATEQLLAQTRQDFARVLQGIRSRNPQFDSVLTIRPVNLALWQKSIPENSTLVQYFPAETALYVFVVTSRELKIRRVAVPSKELMRSALKLRGLLAAFPGSGSADNGPLVRESRRLYDWLIGPIESDLGSRPVLAIIPSGALHYVPYPALIRRVTASKVEYLVQSRQCVNLVKAADLSMLVQPPTDRQAKGLLALANPDGTLPGAEREARHIASFFATPVLRLGSQASLLPMPQTVEYLHLATHGYLLPDQPNNSYLRVAGQGETGKLRIGEIYALALGSVRLVVLSACQSALPETSTGSEVVSLAQAFSVAGGRAVLASLWSVSDEGTEKLMVSFYRHLAAHESLAESLQKAQLSMLAQPGLSHPFFWAAFPLFGDWR